MKTKIQIKSTSGSLLFEFEKEENTIKDTLIEAIISGANLYGAYLYGANLSGANYRNIKIKKLFLSNTLYTYLAGSIISEDNKQYIILGCHCRLVSDWERDFWNNNSEFPNDGSEKSENRKRAFNVCNAWIENYR